MQSLLDILIDASLHLANEAKGDMDLFLGNGFGAGE